jgi:hypothetical protein
MTFEFDAPTDLETGNFLRAPGIYHLAVTKVDERPTNKANNLINGFKIFCEVLHGGATDADGNAINKGKQVDMIFFDPKLTDKDEGKMARQKQARFLAAVGLLTKEDLGKKVEIKLADAESRQFVAALELDQNQRFLQLRFLDLWHVDDPACKDTPKDKASIDLLPESMRMIGNRSDGKKESAPAQQSPPKTVDMDDI